MDPLLENLTEAQSEAVCHRDGPQLILAGPGSGKTRVVTHRIAWLLREGVAPRAILALTFTNKAAEEMSQRVERLASAAPVWISTFHRFCARLLRQHGDYVGLPPHFSIYDAGDSRSVLRSVIRDEDLDAQFTAEQFASAISWAKNRAIRAENYTSTVPHRMSAVVERVYPRYQARLRDCDAVDFDDLLLYVATLLEDHPEVRAELDERYRYVMVDEYQDTNQVQYRIARLLSVEYPNLSATGDPDQSIYSWRGADVGNILEFERDYPDAKIVRLEQNYRSTQRILNVAGEFISHNRRRKKKELFTENDRGAPVRLVRYATHLREAEAIAARISADLESGRRQPRDFAVFYRVNALSRPLEQAFHKARVPYQLVGAVEFFQRAEIKDVLAYLLLVNNPRDEVALRRVINAPPRGISPATLERLATYAVERAIPLLEAARQSGLVEGLPKRAPIAVARFVALYDSLTAFAAGPVTTLLRETLERSGYREHLSASGDPADQERLANVDDLVSAAAEFDLEHPENNALETFLEQVSLVNDTDDLEGGNAVTLMTLHSAKGLEFPVVFITALEQGILPHERSLGEPDELEEERRLLFVGMTRAREELHLSLAQRRDFRGRSGSVSPSMFVNELPRGDLEIEAEQQNAVDPKTFSPSAPRDRTQNGGATAVVTAAELAGERPIVDPERVPPEYFVAGMVVRHPEYGVGKIVAIDVGLQRVAKVVFPGGAGERRFVLESAELQPSRWKTEG